MYRKTFVVEMSDRKLKMNRFKNIYILNQRIPQTSFPFLYPMTHICISVHNVYRSSLEYAYKQYFLDHSLRNRFRYNDSNSLTHFPALFQDQRNLRTFCLSN